MDHRGTASAARQRNLERGAIGSALGKHGIGEKIGAVDREGMHAEEIDFFRNVVGTEWTMADFFSTGSDHDGMEFVFAANGTGNQASPVDGHGVGGLRLHNPERRLIGEVPGDDRALVGIASPKLGGEIRLEPQHFRIGMRMPSVPPGHIPICLADLAAYK